MTAHSLSRTAGLAVRLASATLLLSLACAASAQVPAAAPAGANGICKDGTYSTASSKSGACRGHKGVQTWYKADIASAPAPTSGKAAAAPVPTAKSSTTTMPAPTPAKTQTMPVPAPASNAVSRPAPTPTPGVPSRPAPSAATNTPAMPAPQPGQTAARPNIATESARLKSGPAAAGGGPGLVWVNASSKVYHCPGSDFYGKTKAGSYMPEADAKAQGARPDHNKPCS